MGYLNCRVSEIATKWTLVENRLPKWKYAVTSGNGRLDLSRGMHKILKITWKYPYEWREKARITNRKAETCIFRPHRMQSINMRPIATDGLSGNSSACMCDGHNGDLCNIWLNRSRCHLRNRLVMAKKSTYIRWGCCCSCCCCWWRAHQLPPSRQGVHTSCQWERLARKSWVMDRESASGGTNFFQSCL